MQIDLYSHQMKRIHLIVFALVLILGQWSSLEHAYHEHNSNEVCDYCLSIKPLDNAATNSAQAFVSNQISHNQDELTSGFIPSNLIRHFSVRAPPLYS
jgi:hypothetical protein